MMIYTIFDIIVFQSFTDVDDSMNQVASESENELGVKFTLIREELEKTDNTINALNEQIGTLTNGKEQLKANLEKVERLFLDYITLSDKIMKKQDSVLQLYKDIVSNGEMLGGLLSLSERSEITNEVKKAKELFNLGIRNKEAKDLVSVFRPTLFNYLLEKLRTDCPTIIFVMEQLVISTKNAGRNVIKTLGMKMKAVVHLLSSLMDVRDQNGSNDIPILFGLLCMCYGAGPSIINLLQRLGLSESHQVL